ncbi:Arv1-like family-domain-containing protein [Umbelopsis sp. PMI_123]|nr:Arv1-like family-domain-containing protein [Umbelopsis sp. PMI_123]
MPICVECDAPVATLYTEYSKGNIRLTSCEKCNHFADKYIEYDFVIIFIDMLLHKPQVYRHLLFNRITYTDEKSIEPNIMKLAVLLILFEVYIKWFRLEKYYTGSDSTFMEQPLFYQYLYILLLCIIEFVAFHLGVHIAVRWLFRGRNSQSIRPNFITMALIVSSFGKMLLILMVIWDYKQLEYSWLVSIIVLTSNIEALSVFLHIGYLQTFYIISFGIALRLLAQLLFLGTTYKGTDSLLNFTYTGSKLLGI